MNKERDDLRGTLSNAICNASLYPERALPYLIGGDMSGVLDRATDAVLAEGYRKPDDVELTSAHIDELVRLLGESRNVPGRVSLPREAVNMLLEQLGPKHATTVEREAREALTRVEGLHRPERRWLPYRDADRSYDTAEEAAQDLGHTYTIDPANMPYFEVCAHCKTVEEGPCDGECTKELGYRESLWPCPTARAAVAAANGEGEDA